MESGPRDSGRRRSGIDRRQFNYSKHIPERRLEVERRSGEARRSGLERRGSVDRRRTCHVL